MTQTPASFCILIVNYHGREDTVACVASALAAAQKSDTSVKVLVVDNTADEFNFADDRVHTLRTGHNIGLSGAWYVGFYSATAQSCDYVILLNNDAVVAEDFFARLQTGIDRWGADCAFGPRIYHAADHGLIWSRGGEIARFTVKVRHFGENTRAEQVETGDFETGHLSGCCMIVRTAHLNRIGGPDTNFFFRGEEWDLNYRLRQAGIRLVILDRAEVFHEINGSHERFNPKMLYFAYRAKVLFAKKILPSWYFPIWFTSAVVFSVVLAAPRFARHSKYDTPEIRKALTRALYEGLKHDKILPPAEC